MISFVQERKRVCIYFIKYFPMKERQKRFQLLFFGGQYIVPNLIAPDSTKCN